MQARRVFPLSDASCRLSAPPLHRTHGGVTAGPDGLTFTAPAIMWVKALDMLMDKLRVAGLDFSRVAALSGAGQVRWWNTQNTQMPGWGEGVGIVCTDATPPFISAALDRSPSQSRDV